MIELVSKHQYCCIFNLEITVITFSSHARVIKQSWPLVNINIWNGLGMLLYSS